MKVNRTTTNADQFQPYLRSRRAGSSNVSFFDRRLDDPADHRNFFIDTWLARSNDGGATFGETRVSHDSWDPSINPPISDSGEFIGDYQGLVADDCIGDPVRQRHAPGQRPGARPRLRRGRPALALPGGLLLAGAEHADFSGNGPVCPAPVPIATPTPPAAQPATTPLLAFFSRRVRVSRAGRARLTMRCNSARPCRITVTLVARRGRYRAARRTFTLLARERRSVTFRVSNRARRAMRRARRHTLTATATARTNSAGRTRDPAHRRARPHAAAVAAAAAHQAARAVARF